MDLIYKKASLSDWKIVSEFEKSVGNSKIYFGITDEKGVKNYILNSNVYLIYLQEKQIGTVSFKKTNVDQAHIDGLIILSEYRNKGYATQAVKWLLENMNGCKEIDLLTHPENTPAIKVYEKLGFKIESTLKNPFGDGEPRLRFIKNIK